LNVEHWRARKIKEQQEEKEGEAEDEQISKLDGDDDEEDEEGMWDESFNSKTDSKPRGMILALTR
jgi:hypothetical protein